MTTPGSTSEEQPATTNAHEAPTTFEFPSAWSHRTRLTADGVPPVDPRDESVQVRERVLTELARLGNVEISARADAWNLVAAYEQLAEADAELALRLMRDGWTPLRAVREAPYIAMDEWHDEHQLDLLDELAEGEAEAE